MKKTPLRRIGKIGKANLEARKRIAAIAEEKGLNYCEIGLPECFISMYLAPAHRHKRSWYKGNIDLLSDFSQWISACQNCHDIIENDAALTEKLFTELHPPIIKSTS